MTRRHKSFQKLFTKEVGDLELKELARMSGVSYNTLITYKHGTKSPLPPTAAKLDEALGITSFTKFARIKRNCKTCGKVFFTTARTIARFCSRTCSQFEKRSESNTNESMRRSFEIRKYQESVLLHCQECIGEELTCPNKDCALRPVSPIPLPERKSKDEERYANLRRSHTATRPAGGGTIQRRISAGRP